MKYEERLQKYLNGELPLEESAEIEADMEKFQALFEYTDGKLDKMLYEPEEDRKGSMEENREISKAVSRKFRKYAAATGAIVLAAVLLVLFGLSPFLDKVCYDPDTQIEKVSEDGNSAVVYSPFSVTMSAYMELFCGDKGFADVSVWPEGYGRYSLDVQTQINGDISHNPMELVRNHLYRQNLNWNASDLPGNAFTYLCAKDGDYCGLTKEQAREKLEKLPEELKVRAAISFDEIKSVQELTTFMEQYETQYLYVPMVVADEGNYGMYWGFAPEDTGYVLTECYDQDKYPYLDLSQCEEEEIPAQVMEQHVNSMLKYLSEQEEFGAVFDSNVPGENVFDEQKYESALEYIESKGVNCYGAVVNATRNELLALLEDESVHGAYLMDSKLELQ